MSGDVKYFGSAILGMFIGTALGVWISWLTLPGAWGPGYDETSGMLAAIVTTAGVIAGYSAGAWVGIEWESRGERRRR